MIPKCPRKGCPGWLETTKEINGKPYLACNEPGCTTIKPKPLVARPGPPPTRPPR